MSAKIYDFIHERVKQQIRKEAKFYEGKLINPGRVTNLLQELNRMKHEAEGWDIYEQNDKTVPW